MVAYPYVIQAYERVLVPLRSKSKTISLDYTGYMGFLAELKATGLKDIRNTSILKATLDVTGVNELRGAKI